MNPARILFACLIIIGLTSELVHCRKSGRFDKEAKREEPAPEPAPQTVEEIWHNLCEFYGYMDPEYRTGSPTDPGTETNDQLLASIKAWCQVIGWYHPVTEVAA